MLLTRNVRIMRIVKLTWKVDLIMLLTCSLTFYAHEQFVANPVAIPAATITLLGTALAFFLAFNNNQAYDRWWEARIIWGALVNDSRSWARNLLEYTEKGDWSEEHTRFLVKRMIYRHIGFVYALKSQLREDLGRYWERFLTREDLEEVSRHQNVANAILSINARELSELYRQKAVDGFRFNDLNSLLTAHTDHMGKSERIKNTVFPTSYIYFTRLFIWLFVIVTTLVLSEDIGVWSILVGWILGFVFHVTHQNGMSLVNPFEATPASTPINQIARTIEINLLEMTGQVEVPEPEPTVNDEYVL